MLPDSRIPRRFPIVMSTIAAAPTSISPMVPARLSGSARHATHGKLALDHIKNTVSSAVAASTCSRNSPQPALGW